MMKMKSSGVHSFGFGCDFFQFTVQPASMENYSYLTQKHKTAVKKRHVITLLSAIRKCRQSPTHNIKSRWAPLFKMTKMAYDLLSTFENELSLLLLLLYISI